MHRPAPVGALVVARRVEVETSHGSIEELGSDCLFLPGDDHNRVLKVKHLLKAASTRGRFHVPRQSDISGSRLGSAFTGLPSCPVFDPEGRGSWMGLGVGCSLLLALPSVASCFRLLKS